MVVVPVVCATQLRYVTDYPISVYVFALFVAYAKTICNVGLRCYFFFFWSLLMVLRVYSLFSIQGSLLVGLGRSHVVDSDQPVKKTVLAVLFGPHVISVKGISCVSFGAGDAPGGAQRAHLAVLEEPCSTQD